MTGAADCNAIRRSSTESVRARSKRHDDPPTGILKFVVEAEMEVRWRYSPSIMKTVGAHLPSKIEQRDPRTLAILWSDGVESLIDVRALRLACGCANCVDEWSGEALLAPENVPADVAPVGLESIGRYAIQINWSDGHSTGIYPFERLRKLSEGGHLDPIRPRIA